MTEFELGRFPSLFVRVKGSNSRIREYRALVDPAYEYCIVPKGDAYVFGHPEVAFQHETVGPPNARTLMTAGGFSKTVVFEVEAVEIGGLSFEKVEFAAIDLPQEVGFEAVIGQSLLKHAVINLDWKKRLLGLTKAS
ncbi:MAG: hypothetical protein JRN27_00955 [Nitrososphaerota archaeon]|nr:hypothetical protein [Nitrososphaerota archaeon]MDG6974650.1 hypothetical protein [Nitrososphaerota archaeon]MDG6980883.1 hypothetical protein [Nitrososphaerota archaeon]MDG7030837.1 hypothetical protein [Nitrososphaerota archaeon]